MSDPPITEAPQPVAPAPYMPGSVEAAFTIIEQAARMIAIVDPEALADRLRQGIDASFYTDPTLARRYLAQQRDMERKLRILDDAARLVGNWNVVREAPRG